MSIKPHDIIVEGDDLLQKMADIDTDLYKVVVRYLAENSKSGKIAITNEQLAGLEDILYDEIKKTDYEKNLTKYLELFDALEAAVSIEQLKVNGIKAQAIRDLWNSAIEKQILKEKIVYDLGRNGLKNVFVRGIADAIRETSYFNLDIKSAMDVLKTKLVDEPYTHRYLKNAAMGSLAEYDGAIQDKVRVTYDFHTMVYITNTIETSRPVCDYIKDTLGGRITDTELQKVLDEYCPNGMPNKKDYVSGKRKVKHKDGSVEFKDIMVPKGSGMVENTFLTNWSQQCGGHANGCRHRALWTR
jgi:hypothetical protein